MSFCFFFLWILAFLKPFIVMCSILEGAGMEEVKSYNFEESGLRAEAGGLAMSKTEMPFNASNQVEFNKIEKLADSIYNISVVLDYFCSNQREIEELYNLTPIIKN